MKAQSDPSQERHFVEVAVPPLKKTLLYQCNPSIGVGYKVSVLLNRRTCTGYVVGCYPSNPIPNADFTVHSISDSAGEPAFPEDHLNFFKWIADYYFEPLSSVIDAALPKLSPSRSEKFYRLRQQDAQAKGHLQRKVLEYLVAHGNEASFSELKELGKGVPACLSSLIKRGEIELLEKGNSRISVMRNPSPAELSPEQSKAAAKVISSINNQEAKTYLLQGITGSGKTEIYINSIITARNLGRSCLLLVPEISLTPQLVTRLSARLGEPIAVLHSGLTQSQRSNFWRSILEGDLKIILGARSAIFAPCQNLGLIVVDEEHDHSFKQSDSLRYNARDLATVRGQLSNCPVILGSATPSLESYLNAFRGKHELLTLRNRFGSAKLPSFKCVDLSRTSKKHMITRNVSSFLYNDIQETLKAGNQVFLLFNRRGYASFLLCNSCGDAIFCPHCDVTLTYHENSKKLLCHYCFLHLEEPKRCPSCSSPNLQKLGAGTERIFEEITNCFPEAKIDRLDRDSAKRLSDYETILNKVKKQETQILVGTQIIAKGHDLPSVTLVGVIDCDVGLHIPDFRSAEKAYQLLTQVGGRAGRGSLPGRVILQTRNPGHPSIVAAMNRDYEAFAATELKQRKELNYPPFWRILRIVASSLNEDYPQATLNVLTKEARQASQRYPGELFILGPSPAPISKVKDRFRWHIIIKAKNVTVLHNLMRHLKSGWKAHPSTRVTFDLDAYDML